MEIIHLNPGPVPRVAQAMQAEDVLGWCKSVSDFLTASGARCLLEHVTPDQWMQHYAANETSYESVLAELQKVE